MGIAYPPMGLRMPLLMTGGLLIAIAALLLFVLVRPIG
jgi:hypothetical protein